MSWQTEATGLLRVYINDMDTPYRYSDARLEQVLVSSAKVVLFDTGGKGFANEFQADITSGTITPDPTDDASKDDNFINLIVLKAGCFIDNCEARTAARKAGMVVKEFSSSFDNRGLADARLKILDKGWCKTYDDSLFDFLAGSSFVCTAILSPFRTYYTAGYFNRDTCNGR